MFPFVRANIVHVSFIHKPVKICIQAGHHQCHGHIDMTGVGVVGTLTSICMRNKRNKRHKPTTC